MKGHIRKRGKDSWTVYIYQGRDGQGKPRYRTHTVKGTKDDAENERIRLLNSVNEGTYVKPNRLTLAMYLEQWILDYVEPKVSRKTRDRYIDIVRSHLVPNLGRHRLSKLTPVQIQSYYSQALKSGRLDGKPGGLSPQTVIHHHRVLRQALQQAVRWQILMRNPADAATPPRAPRREMNVLDEKQLLRLFEAAEGSDLYLPIVLAATTGMRRGEVLALRWSDVDLDSRFLSVQRSLEQARGGVQFKEPKSPRARRIIDLPSITVDALRQHKIAQARHRLQIGPTYKDQGLVCSRLIGTPLDPAEVTSAFAALMRKTDLPRVRFHDLRHSHATNLMRQDVHPKIVSERLGHSTVGITLDIYSHVTRGMQKETANRIDKAFRDARRAGRKGA